MWALFVTAGSAIRDRMPAGAGWYRDPAALRAGARLALVVAVPFLALYFAGAQLVAIWAMLGALNIVLSGYGGSRRLIVLTMTALALAMATAALVGPLIAHSSVAVVLSTLVAGFAAGWLGLLSDYWRVGGPLALIVFVISVSVPGNIDTGLEAAIGVLVGGGAALAGMLLLPGASSAGLRDPLAASFESAASTLGRLVPARGGETGSGPAKAAAGGAAVGLEALRSRLEETRELLAANAWATTGRAPGEHLRVALIHDAERIAGDVGRLVALLGEEPLGRDERRLAAPLVEAVVEASHDLAASIRDGRPAETARLRAAAAQLGDEPSSPALIALRGLADDVIAATANAAELARPIAAPGAVRVIELGRSEVYDRRAERRSVRRALRRELSLESPYLLYGFRLGVAVAAATALYLTLGLSNAHGLWIPVTAVVVIQPTLEASVERALERVVGTLVGVAIALGLLALIEGEDAVIVVLFPFLLFATVYFGRINYGVAVVFITLSVVLLFDFLSPAGASTGLERLTGTAIGIAIAAVATFALWPRSLHRTLIASAAGLIDACARCLAASPETGGDPPRDCGAAAEALFRYRSAERLYVRQPGDLALDRGALYELDRASQRLFELGTTIRSFAQPTRRGVSTSMADDVARLEALEQVVRDGGGGAIQEDSRTVDAGAAAEDDARTRYLAQTARAEIDGVERAVAGLRPSA